jgi:hypothetical protein
MLLYYIFYILLIIYIFLYIIYYYIILYYIVRPFQVGSETGGCTRGHHDFCRGISYALHHASPFFGIAFLMFIKGAQV